MRGGEGNLSGVAEGGSRWGRVKFAQEQCAGTGTGNARVRR